MGTENATNGVNEPSAVSEGETENHPPSAISNPLDHLFPTIPRPQPAPKQHVQPTTKRHGPKTTATPKGIPNSWEEAGELDRTLVTMRAEGKTWPEVRDAWTAKSGEKPGTSSLPNRFRRIAVNLMWGKENMEKHLEDSIAEVEAKFEAEKWAQVAELIKTKGSGSYSYPPEFLQKKAQDVKVRAKKLSLIPNTIPDDYQTLSTTSAVNLTILRDAEAPPITVFDGTSNDHTHAEAPSPTPPALPSHNDTLSGEIIYNDIVQRAVPYSEKSKEAESHQSSPNQESSKSTQPPLNKIAAKRVKRKLADSPVMEAYYAFGKYLDKNPSVGRYISVTEENGPWRRVDGGKVPWRRKAYIMTKFNWNASLCRWTRLGRPMAGELEVYPSILAIQRRRPDLTVNADKLINIVEWLISGIPRDDIRKAAHLWKRFDLGKLNVNNDELWMLDTEPLDVAKSIGSTTNGHGGIEAEQLPPPLVESESEDNEEFYDADGTSHTMTKSTSKPAPQANMSRNEPTPETQKERTPMSFIPFIDDLYHAASSDPIEETGVHVGHTGGHSESQRSSTSPDSALLDPALRTLPENSTANSNELPVVRMLENVDILARDLNALIRAATSAEKGHTRLKDLRKRIDVAGAEGGSPVNLPFGESGSEVSPSVEEEEEESGAQPGRKRRRLA